MTEINNIMQNIQNALSKYGEALSNYLIDEKKDSLYIQKLANSVANDFDLAEEELLEQEE